MPPEEATELARHVARECSHLRLAGLMTIGQPDYSSRPENFEVPPAFNVRKLGKGRHAGLSTHRAECPTPASACNSVSLHHPQTEFAQYCL